MSTWPRLAREIEAPDVGERGAVDTGLAPPWMTILHNCDCHTFDEVERALVAATRCSLARARELSNEVHTRGSAVVYRGARERCEAVADAIGSTGLQVKVSE